MIVFLSVIILVYPWFLKAYIRRKVEELMLHITLA